MQTMNAAEIERDEQGTQDTAPVENDAQEAAQGREPAPAVKEDGSPYTQSDIDALQEALRKARRDARQAKRGRGVEPAEGDEPAGGDVEKVRAEVEREQTAKWKGLVVRTAARTAFVEAGLTLPKDGGDEAMARVLRLLDLDDLDVTEDGEVDGLREQVEDIRRDFPELFATARRAPRVDAAGKTTPVDKPQTATEKLAAQLLGRR